MLRTEVELAARDTVAELNRKNTGGLSFRRDDVCHSLDVAIPFVEKLEELVGSMGFFQRLRLRLALPILRTARELLGCP
ncbi:MAG TPA: hypothetical protein VFX29_05505 [Longimicrobiaceae bacterium]|nr:hypothetical protein [Longimicrobiaceae bacterium]